MNLTGKQLVEEGIIFNGIEKDNIQQHGVDLNLIKVQRIQSKYGAGFIPKNGRTVLSNRETVMYTKYYTDGRYVDVWQLSPGVYDITFEQGCKIPNNQRGEIYQRSSLLRNAAILRSSVFDAGFETANIGTVIVLHESLAIEVGARVAQFVCTRSNFVDNLYDGQWQGDKQREEVKPTEDETFQEFQHRAERA